MSPLRSSRPLMLLAAALAVASPQATLPWESMRWTVSCTPELEEAIAASAVDIQVSAVCDPASPASAAAAARYELDTASPWLRDLGFGGPRVSERDGARYVARLDNFGLSYSGTCDHNRASFNIDRHVLRVSPCFHFAFVEQADLGHLQNRGALIGLQPVHELFHAVQLGYTGMNVEPPARWIAEGTALLAEVAAARRAGTPYPDPTSFHRYYDMPLHVPREVPEQGAGSPAWQIWTYGSWAFWDFLGEHLDSPDRIQYLHTIFQQTLTGSNNGLTGVEAGLKALGTNGLYDLYPAFVAARLNEPCYFEDLGAFDRTTAGAPCVTRPSDKWIDLRPGETRRVVVDPAEMAAEAFVVRTELPEDRVGWLEVEIPDAEDDPAYHLVVGRKRADVAGGSGFPFGVRNRFLERVAGGRQETLVKVAHVPEDIAGVDGGVGFRFGPDITVNVTLHVDDYRLTVAGDASAKQSGTVAFRGLQVEVPDIAAAGDLCHVSIRFVPPRGTGRGPEGVTFGFDVLAAGGLRTGSYEVAPDIRADTGSEIYALLPPTTRGGTRARRSIGTNMRPAPDVFSAGLLLGHGVDIHYGDTATTAVTGVPGPQGLPRPYGTVVIRHIDSRRISGTFDVRIEAPYRRVPTGPEAGAWHRDEIANIRVIGGFSATFETLAQFRGLIDGINYCRPRGGA